jgi:hypothetical protein
MAIFSAYEDLLLRTLSRIGGPLKRAQYLSKLRNEEGFAHWGLARAHGSKEASSALAQAYKEACVAVLRTPIRELHQDLCCEEGRRDWAKPDFPQPDDLGGCSPRHFKSVVFVLSALAQGERSRAA